ncbi:hypothetical protein LIER_35486 [Lithospermum erythrorhizon]|uniref:Uncharacterized protein n=1 Tax=Lithospermum erythrorhizon TaxID=34254 RepID=A0AAV3NRH3_LITER
MVKPRPDEGLNEGGGSYLSIEKAMKKKKKRKNPPPENETSNLVASNADPSLLVRVSHDNRVNVDGVLDKHLQLEVEKWGQTDSPCAVMNPCGSPAGLGNMVVAPQSSYVVALSSELDVVSHGIDGDKTQVVSKNVTVSPVSRLEVGGDSIVGCSVAPQSAVDVQYAPHAGVDAVVNTGTWNVVRDMGGDNNHSVPVVCPCDGPGSSSGGPNKSPLAVKGLVFKAGGSGAGSVPKHAGSTAKGPKAAGRVHQRARPVLSRGSGADFAAGPVPNRPKPPNTRPIRPGAVFLEAVPAGPPKGAKYDFLENDDDVILDESDEIPFVET